MSLEVGAADPSAMIRRFINGYLKSSPDNKYRNGTGEPIWEEALVGFAAGDDPIFESFKDHVGPFHFTPEELFRLTFPEEEVSPADLVVISWVLPQREAAKADNRATRLAPAERWSRSRAEGEDFNLKLRQWLVDVLAEGGIKSLSPQLSPHWSRETSPQYGFASRFSERHAAYAAGLGTFGLCDGLITPKGKAHRLGSVIARMNIPATPRPYDHHRAYCLYFHDGSCLSCAERCPVGAVSELGHDKDKCYRHLHEYCDSHAKEKYGFSSYGCGLCQTGVPCESGIPVPD